MSSQGPLNGNYNGAPNGPLTAPLNSHFSTSSSVYSPVESEFPFHQQQIEALNEIEELDPHEVDSDWDDDEPASSSSRGIATEESNQTFQTFMTARGLDFSEDELSNTSHQFPVANPSFDSINRSLLNTDTVNESYHDEDKTPKLPQNGYANDNGTDSVDDKTPLMNTEGFDASPSPHLPQQELSSKFQRLSVTLQHTTASGDSHQFMNTFQQNVNRLSKPGIAPTSRYYNKIEQFQADDNTDTESAYIRDEQASQTSSTSQRSSVISQSSNIDHLSTTQSTQSTTSSSSAFVFNQDSGSSYNLRGSRVSPVKAQTQTSTSSSPDVPIRRDLISQFEKISSNKDLQNMTEQEKNDLLIASKNGLNISFAESEPQPSTTITKTTTNSTTNLAEDDDSDLSSLFIRALHPFDSSTLQSESDASICLSFDKDDLAFVHTIDDSGWGEVTLVDSLQRGWIPMNYFEIAIDEPEAIPNSSYLKPLFHSCAKFLMNPLSHQNRRGKYTFSIRTINAIRDGVRLLLQHTDCLSRSNEIVTKRPVVRKSRKSLLADWYNLMVKANEFKGTSNFNKIEILTLMIYQVTRKAVTFLQIWSIESRELLGNATTKESDIGAYPTVASPPLAKHRITEINGILYSYLGLIIGRLDLIEHNPVGCDTLETMAHHIILLLRELLFISKLGSDFSHEKPADLDGSLDSLLSLVSDLVTSVKNLVVKTLNESEADKRNTSLMPSTDTYYYTPEGGDLIQIASKMIKSIATTIMSIRRLLEVTGDFKLSADRSYPDYTAMKIDPEQFIRQCSVGIASHTNTNTNSSSNNSNTSNSNAFRPVQRSSKKANRYSMIRSGKTGELGLTSTGASLLQDVLGTGDGEGDTNSPFSVSIPAFEPYTSTTTSTTNTTTPTTTNAEDINNELLVDRNGNLLGASFHGLVYTLTNETSPPEYFFVSTFFICFRTFANGIDFIEEMITRFDMARNITSNAHGHTRADITAEVQLKKRRRLIVKMFQIWMESYWNHESDYSLLTTLINFFNEGISQYLPLEAMKLIEVAARLSTKPLIENQIQLRTVPRYAAQTQLVNRSITIARFKRKNSFSSHNGDGSLSNRYSMVDGYELSKINTNSSTTSSLKSISLPMPLGIGNQTSSSNSLLTKNQFQTIERVNNTYRQILTTSWCPQTVLDAPEYISLDLGTLLPNWFQVCDQTWVLSNYRPNLLDFNGLELAKQLTIIESSIFCSIKPEELLNENFTAKRAYLRLAPNVRQSLLFTNCLSGYVLESILQPKINQKLRVNMIKTWLKVAISCLYLRNFNSLAAIITSLQSHLITRLDKLREDLSDKYTELYDYLATIIQPDKNYHVYRTKLKNFLVSNDYNIPIVPYFSLFLQDLTFVTEGNPNYRKANTFLNQKLINIDKYLKITRIIADIESLQIPYTKSSTTTSTKELKRSSIFLNNKLNGGPEPEDYSIVSVPSLQELILLELWKVCQLNKAEEDRAWKLSCTIQPRDISN
ncbi:uncharacterized protein RJT21DRAFT_117070 [Scheffersomyces amazonensis]|uniref:uncharacterized protein n=1 Tax=Scheffersomyces amazonensis TaxID=1078765 RepID=UPI00315D27DA